VPSAELLADVNRWVGVIVAVVGTVVAAPSGTRELLTSTWQWLERRGSAVSSGLGRLLPFLRGDAAMNPKQSVTGTASTSWGFTSSASAWAWPSQASTDERIEALRKHLTEVEGRLSEVRKQLRDESAARKQAVEELEQRIRADIREIKESIDRREKHAARIDARGLPLIAAGVVLSGVPDDLARFLYPLGWLWVIIAVAVCAGVSVSAWRDARAVLQPLTR
jgi:hypothetical protein